MNGERRVKSEEWRVKSAECRQTIVDDFYNIATLKSIILKSYINNWKMQSVE